MSKEEFLSQLRNAISGLPCEDIEERLTFYGEMIDDRMEEGLTEEEAILEIGTVEDITAQIIADIPLTKLVKERIQPKRAWRAWEIILIALGFPLWFSLLIAAAVVVFSLYIVIWAVILSLWAIEISFWSCMLFALAATAVYAYQGYVLQGIVALGMGLFCAGISILMFFCCVSAVKGVLHLTKKSALLIKTSFIRKERAK